MADVLALAQARREPDQEDDPRRIISRLHMAETLRRKGYAASREEAFQKYVGAGAPAYVDKERVPPRAIVASILAAGGAAVLAHPAQLHLDSPGELDRLVRSLRDMGLQGIEVYRTDHTDAQTRRYLDLARRLGLLVTGGSDYHGETKPGVRIGRPRVPLSVLTGPLAERLLGRG
jgi:predicted metal-dependent phosphoesterase TrpH